MVIAIMHTPIQNFYCPALHNYCRVNLTNLGSKDQSETEYFESGIGHMLTTGAADLAIELFLDFEKLFKNQPKTSSADFI